VTIPGTIAVVDGVIAGVIVAEALVPLGWPGLAHGGAAIAVGLGVTAALGYRSKRRFNVWAATAPSKFPDSPTSTGSV
jgi:hypothetical protein